VKLKRFAAMPLLVLAGCGGSPYTESLKYDRLREYKGPDSGTAVASVGHLKSAPYSASSLTFRLKGTNDLGLFIYAPKSYKPSPTDFNTTDAEGTVMAVRLPPGEYEIYSATGDWGAGAYRFSAGVGIKPAWTFKVETGRVSYVGRFLVGFRGDRESPPASVASSDTREADLLKTSTRDPNLNTRDVQFFLPPGDHGKY
jgi:hypothetical protein